MNRSETTSQNDPSLLRFLNAPDLAESEASLSHIISEQTESTIKGILRNKLRVSLSATDGSHNNQEALDLLTEVQTVLLEGLRELKTDASVKSITNFQGYVAAVTFNACHQLLRRKYPKRLQLKNRLRYLLTHEPNLALWESNEEEWLCGLAAWCGKERLASMRSLLPQLRDREQRFSPIRATHERQALIDLLTSIFKSLDGPLSLDELVTLVADLHSIKEDIALGVETAHHRSAQFGLDFSARAAALAELEQRAQLQKLWSEICQLPLRHRSALLLNLRDKQGATALDLFPLTRVATIRQIGELLAFSPEHFAKVWNELPWDDVTIAEHLALTRQQVINLRQSARARLGRRMKDF